MIFDDHNGHRQGEVEAAHSLLSQTAVLLDESRALSCALAMVLAHTPRQELSSEDIDGLCQLAYELLNRITKTHDIFQETRHQLLVGALSRTVDKVLRSCE
jgi:hypothetical protein